MKRDPWVCICYAHSEADCVCGAWDVPIPDDWRALDWQVPPGTKTIGYGMTAQADRSDESPVPEGDAPE